jgi:hypothetical protein
MAELVYQTWQRITGKPWSAAAAGGFTTGGYNENLALQQRLLSGWNPYAPAAPAPAAATPAAATTRQSAAEAATAKTADLYARQKAEEDAKIAALRAYVSGAEPLPDLYARLGQEMGIPGLQAQLEPVRQQTLRAESELATLPEDLLAVTRGQGEARRKLLEASKSDVLRRQLTELARAQELYAGQLAGAQNALGTQMSLYGEQYNRGLLPFETDLSTTEQRLAREASGYTQAFQNELTAILGDIQAAEDLAKEQRDRAFDLAKMEKEYQYNASLARINNAGSGTSAAANELAAARASYTSEVNNAKAMYKGKGVTDAFLRIAGKYSGIIPNYELFNIWSTNSGYGPATETVAQLQNYGKTTTGGGGSPW